MIIDLDISTFEKGPLKDFLKINFSNSVTSLLWLNQKVTSFPKHEKSLGIPAVNSAIKEFLCDYLEPRRSELSANSDYLSFRDEAVLMQQALKDYVSDNSTSRNLPPKIKRIRQAKNALIKDFVEGLTRRIFSEPNIMVTPVIAVEEMLDQNPDIDAVLSIEHEGAQTIADGRAPRLGLRGVEQKIISFYDVENAQAPNGPSEKLIKEALDFLERHKDKRVLIHCRAGKSRSVGLALAWVAKERGCDEAIKWMKEHRNNAAPNILVLHHADQLLGLNGSITMQTLKDQEWLDRRTRLRARMRKEYGPNTW